MIDHDGRYHITKLIIGSRISDMLEFARYDKGQLSDAYRRQVNQRVDAGMLTREAADQLVHEYEALANRTTYLE